MSSKTNAVTALERLGSTYASVESILVVNESGYPVYAAGMPDADKCARQMTTLKRIALNAVRGLEPEDDLVLMRLRCGHLEYVMGVETDHLVVVRQNIKRVYKDVERENADASDSEGMEAGETDVAAATAQSAVIGAAAALAFENEIQAELKNIATATGGPA